MNQTTPSIADHTPLAEPCAPGAGGPHDPDGAGVRSLDPKVVRLFRSPQGLLRLALKDQACYRRVTVLWVLPLSAPRQYLALWSGEDREIGIITNPDDLDQSSLALVREELNRRYFTPMIEDIYRVRERFGVHEWHVRSSRGDITFFVQGLHQNVKQIPPARLLVTDVRGNRYDIPDFRAMSARSIALIERHL